MDAMEWFVLRDYEAILEVSILILMFELVDLLHADTSSGSTEYV